MNKLLVIDSNAVGYEAFHALGNLSVDDVRTGVIFGFLNRMLQYANKFKTTHFAFCFDSRRSLRREQKYSGYKIKRIEKRKKEPKRQKLERAEAYRQFDLLRETILPHMGFPNIFIKDGYESDDLIYKICRDRFEESAYALPSENSRRIRTVIVSSDHDLFQILEYAAMWHLKRKTIITKDDFVKEFDIRPDQWALAKAIGGCGSDSVPGIDGFADPGKAKKGTGKNNRAIKHIRGVLTGQYEDCLSNLRVRRTICRNLKLVRLPYRGLDEKFRYDISYLPGYDKHAFLEIFQQYKFRSFMGKEFKRWERIFLL